MVGESGMWEFIKGTPEENMTVEPDEKMLWG